jgi:hypothetical protein
MARPGVLSDPGTLAQFKKQRMGVIFLFEGHFLHSNLYLWTGVGTLQWNNINWIGAGTLMGLSSIKETGDLQAVGMTVSLSGIDETIIAAAFNELRQGQPCTVWVALFDFSTASLVTWPYPIFTGRVDVPSIDDSGETATVTLQLENRMVDFERERVRFYDPQTQNIYYPGDRGFDYVASLQDQKIFWGISD